MTTLNEDDTKQSLENIPFMVVTRFSFLGKSGWKSEASTDPDVLFEIDRLQSRLELFRYVTLPSLIAQTDQNFHHYILTSELLPDWAYEELYSLCLEKYGDDARFTIEKRRPSSARKWVYVFLQNQYSGGVVAQIILDDDDGLASNFMAELREQLRLVDAEPPEDLFPLPYFFSFPHGLGLNLRDDGERKGELFSHRYPYINAGLTMIASHQEKNILAIDHKASPRKMGSKLVRGGPKFLRSVHGVNDSRVEVNKNWKELPEWREDESLKEAFPGLYDPEAPWNREA